MAVGWKHRRSSWPCPGAVAEGDFDWKQMKLMSRLSSLAKFGDVFKHFVNIVEAGDV